jgi:heme-degrading monooxygenase HmoA
VFVVLFEVRPKPECWADYLATAGVLRPELERIEGFIDNDRYSRERDPGWALSLSTWTDEKALIRWRTHAMHHEIGQVRGRQAIFDDYKLRVGEVTSDTHPSAGKAIKQLRFDQTEVGEFAELLLVNGSGPHAGLDGYRGIVDPEQWVTIKPLAGLQPDAEPGPRLRGIRVIREYGMRDRREAPQYFPAAQ